MGGVQYLTTSVRSDQVASGTLGTVTVPIPTGATKIHAIIPLGINAYNTWTGVTSIIIRGVNLNERKIVFTPIGTSNQQYDVMYCVIYE